MEKLYNYVCDKLKDLDKKAERSELSTNELQYGDLLAHFGKNLGKMMESEEEGYSERYANDDGYNMAREGSYARGRGRNARRDSMGRYSSYDGGTSYRGGNYRRGGYSRDDATEEYIENLHRLMDEAPDENARMSIKRMIESMERK